MQMQKMGSEDDRSMKSRNNDNNMEIRLDVEDTAVGADVEDPNKRSFPGVRNASVKILQVAEELRRITSFSRKLRAKSAATNALKGLKFIGKTDSATGWVELEKRFEDITSKTDGLLPRSRFGECLGIRLSVYYVF